MNFGNPAIRESSEGKVQSEVDLSRQLITFETAKYVFNGYIGYI